MEESERVRARIVVLHGAYPTKLSVFPRFHVQPSLHLDVIDRRKASARFYSQALFPCFASLLGSSLKFVITEERFARP